MTSCNFIYLLVKVEMSTIVTFWANVYIQKLVISHRSQYTVHYTKEALDKLFPVILGLSLLAYLKGSSVEFPTIA